MIFSPIPVSRKFLAHFVYLFIVFFKINHFKLKEPKQLNQNNLFPYPYYLLGFLSCI